MANLHHQLDLIRWVRREEGFLHPGVEVASDPGNRGFYIRVVAGNTIRPSTRIASCPISTTISILNAMNIAPFSSHGVNFPSPFLAKHSFTVVQHFFLMSQFLLGQKSWWAPYIAAIPTPDAIDRMLFADGSDDMRWLVGTNVAVALAKQNEKWKELYLAASAQLKELRWPNSECYTWRLFLWAAVMFGSRGFTSQVLSDTLPADQARPAGHNHPRHEELSKLFSDGFPVLCPLLDILNYKPGAQVEWQPRFSYIGMQVLEQHESGQEICNNYGPRDNENLMLGYGFAISSNPFDHFAVGLRIDPNSPLSQTRKWYPDKKKDADFQCYIFNLDHPRAKSASCLEASVFSFDLLDSISVLCANDRDFQAMFEAKKTYISMRLASKTATAGNNRNLLQTFVQLYRECRQRLGLLQRTDPMSTGEVARTPQQQYAQVYRASQMEILATATLLSRYTLLRAQTNQSKEEVLQSLTAPSAQSQSRSRSQLDQAASSNLHALVQRHHESLTDPHELIGFGELVPLLRPEESKFARTILASSQPYTLQDIPRVRLVILLTILYKTKTRLPPRFRTWFEKLDSWYDDSWRTLPTDSEDDTDGVRSLLMIVAKAANEAAKLAAAAGAAEVTQRPTASPSVTLGGLIWAWNVVAEESVRLPPGLVAAQDGYGEGRGSDVGSDLLLLYIPRLLKEERAREVKKAADTAEPANSEGQFSAT